MVEKALRGDRRGRGREEGRTPRDLEGGLPGWCLRKSPGK